MEEDQSLNVQLLNHSNQSSSTRADSSASNGDQKSIPLTGKIFLLILVTLIITLSITTLISINSYLKAFHAPVIEVDSVTVHPFNISSSSFSADWTINISIADPDYGASYYYEDMKALIWLNKEIICSKLIGDWILDGAGMKKKTVKIENVVADGVHLKRMKWRRDVTISLRINGSGRKGPEVDNKKRRKKMVAYCDDLRVVFIDDNEVATLIAPPILCYVRLYDNYFL